MAQGYQVTSAEASITSAQSTELAFVLATGALPHKFDFTFTADQIDMTAQGDTSRRMRNGLLTGSGTITAYFPKASRKIGASGNVTFGSALYHVNEWSMSGDWGALDITDMTGSNVLWRQFRPGYLGKFTGSFSGYVDSANAEVPPVDWTGSAAAATFKISEEGATDNSLTCNILATELSLGVDIGQDSLETKRFAYVVDNALTVVGATNFLPAGAMAMPQWYSVTPGIPDRTLVITLASGRTITCAAAYMSGFDITCKMGEMIEVNYKVQIAGAVTFA